MNTAISQRRKLHEDQWPGFCEKLNIVSQWCQRQGLPLAYHFHMGTLIQTSEEIDRLMANTSDDVGLLVDTGHAAFAGGDPLEITKKHIKRIRHVHLKDVRNSLMKSLLNRDTSFIEAVIAGVFTVPGDGDLPTEKIIKALVDGGYDDWIVVEAEQDPEVAPSILMVTKAYQHITQTLHKEQA